MVTQSCLPSVLVTWWFGQLFQRPRVLLLAVHFQGPLSWLLSAPPANRHTLMCYTLSEWHKVYRHRHVTYYQSDTQSTDTDTLLTTRVTQSTDNDTLLPGWHTVYSHWRVTTRVTHSLQRLTGYLLPEWHTVYSHWHVTYYQSNTQSTLTDTLLTTRVTRSLQTLTRYLLPGWHTVYTLLVQMTQSTVTDTLLTTRVTHSLHSLTRYLLPGWYTDYRHRHVIYYLRSTQSTHIDMLLPDWHSLQPLTRYILPEWYTVCRHWRVPTRLTHHYP